MGGWVWGAWGVRRVCVARRVGGWLGGAGGVRHVGGWLGTRTFHGLGGQGLLWSGYVDEVVWVCMSGQHVRFPSCPGLTWQSSTVQVTCAPPLPPRREDWLSEQRSRREKVRQQVCGGGEGQ